MRTRVRARDEGDDEEKKERRGDEMTDVELEREKKLAQWRSEFVGDGYSMRVHRWDKDEKKWEHLDTLDWDGFDVATLRKWVLGKSSRFRLTLLDEKKNYVEGGRVEELVANPDWKEGSAAPAPAAPPENPLNNPIVQLVIENQKAQQTQLLELLKVVAGKPVDKSPDPLDMIVKLKQLMPADQKPPTMKETIETLIALKELSGGEGGAEGGWISEIKEGVSLFSQLSELAAKKRAARGGPTPPAAAPKPIDNPPAKEEPPTVSNPIVDVVRTYIPILVRKAERQDPVDEVAEFLLAELESDVIPLIKRQHPLATEDYIWRELLAGAKDPAKVEEIFGFAPELKAHAEWVQAVIAEAVRQQEGDGAEARA